MTDRRFNEEARRRKSAELKAEREAEAERQRREAAAAAAARRKPHCSSWQDPSFCDRVIARAERHAKALRQIQAGNYAVKSKATAQAKWNAAIEAKVSAGIPKASAIMAVDKQNPGLRQQMLNEVNGR